MNTNKLKINNEKKFTKVSMNLSERTINNVNKLIDITGVDNRTQLVASSIELAKDLFERMSKGRKIMIVDENGDKMEIKPLF